MTRRIIAITLILVMFLAGCSQTNEAVVKEAEEFLVSQLEVFKNADKEQTDEVLGESKNDLGGVDMSLYYKYFDYEIVKTTASDNKANVKLKVKNLDFATLMEDYYEALIPYLASSMQDPEKPAEILKELVESGEYKVIEADATIPLTKKDGVWTIDNTESFMAALLPGIEPIV